MLDYRFCLLSLSKKSRIFLIALVLLTGCGPENKTEQVSAEGLLFTGVDSNFSSSTLYQLDIDEDVVAPILPGQSGDFVILQDDESVIVFNRKADNLNYRQLHFNEDNVAFGEQKAFPAEWVNDPADFVRLDAEHILLAGYSSHALHVVNLASSKVIVSLDSDWDIPGNGPFFPSQITRLTDTRYAILHQGYAADFLSTNVGVIFVVDWQDGQLVPLDRDPDKAGWQGSVLKSHLPSYLFPTDNNIFLSIGLCASWAASCVPAIETFDPETGFVTEKEFQLLETVSTYGSIVPRSGESFYAQIQRDDGAFLSLINLTDASITDIVTYQDVNDDQLPDTGMVVYDQTTDLLYVGEPRNIIEGRIRTFQDNVETSMVETPEIPRQGVLVKDLNVAP